MDESINDFEVQIESVKLLFNYALPRVALLFKNWLFDGFAICFAKTDFWFTFRWGNLVVILRSNFFRESTCLPRLLMSMNTPCPTSVALLRMLFCR